MKIVCFECWREIGEKFPFDDSSATHTICHECVEKLMNKAGKRSARREFAESFHDEVSLEFDPEADSKGVE